MTETYGPITIPIIPGGAGMVRVPAEMFERAPFMVSHPLNGDLSNVKPIGWVGAGSDELVLEEGCYWGPCPACDKECVFLEDGTPTAVHTEVKA